MDLYRRKPFIVLIGNLDLPVMSFTERHLRKSELKIIQGGLV